MADRTIRIATRGSQLARRQTEMVIEHLSARMPGVEFETIIIKTSGDKQKNWSLEKKGGKGLFTKELELAVLLNEADIAVHSAKDLPTEEPEGLTLAGFLPRAPVNDVLITREDCKKICFIASGSPRRRAQLKPYYPHAVWSEMRGNVETRLKKVASGDKVEATVLAAAGLQRLGIEKWPGLTFHELNSEEVVPAVGQGAIALQTRNEDAHEFASLLDEPTARAVQIERRVLRALGGGCHTAMGAHFDGDRLLVYHEKTGARSFPISEEQLANAGSTIAEILQEMGLGET